MTSEIPEHDWPDRLQSLVGRFRAQAQVELRHRMEHWEVDLSRNEVHEVAGALLARQVTLATDIGNPRIFGQVTSRRC